MRTPDEPTDPDAGAQTTLAGLKLAEREVERDRRARRRGRRIALVGLLAIALGALLVALGAWRAAAHGLDVLEAELADAPRDPATGVMRGAEALALGPDDAPAAALLLHGWSTTPRDFGDLPARLADELGWRVRAPLLPGHGTDPRDFAAAMVDDWRAAVRAEHAALAERFERVHVVGFSMGGALAVELAAERELASLVLVAPYFDDSLSPLGIELDALTPFAGRYVEWVDAGPEPRNLEYPPGRERLLRYRAIPLVAVRRVQALGAAAGDPARLARVTEPALLVVGERDGVASPAAARAAFDALGSEVRETAALAGSDHVVLLDREHAAAEDAILAFLRAR